MTEPKRYVRLNPRFDREETLTLLKAEIVQQQSTTTDGNGDQHEKYLLPVKWLRPTNDDGQFEFYAIPGDFRLNRSTSFQSGRVYGMDVTSGAAVLALLFDTYDCNKSESNRDDNVTPLRVLDLCCAPGLKLCMLADLVPLSSTVVGVDISQNRIHLCKNIIKKYHVNQMTSGPKDHDKEVSSSSCSTIRLYCTDGTTFGTTRQLSGLIFDSNAEKQELPQGKRKRQNKSARAREKRRLLELQRQEIIGVDDSSNTEQQNQKCHESVSNQSIETNKTCCIPLFDRILVDAECSTDGAIKHIQKREASSKAPLWNESNMSELVDLQKRLIESGFRLLKKGGILVYSTCSLNERQNEDVVRWLLDKYDDACIIPVSFTKQDDSQQTPSFVEEGSVAGTIRFNPMTNTKKGIKEEEGCLPGTGFFLSKICKRL